MTEEVLIYKCIKTTKWDLFWRKIKNLRTRFKIVDTHKWCLVPWEDRRKQFTLSDKEYEDAKKLYEEKGTISYEFYPCGGIGWGVRIHTLNTNEIIDITDYNNW